MIDRPSIIAWSAEHPWPKKSFAEQDLVICRAIISIFSDPVLAQELAWRGGTALHKLFLNPQVRHSEDIDLVRTGTGPVKPIIERLDAALSWLPGKSFERRRFGFRMKFKYESEFPPVEPMRLKIEANTFEHFSVTPLVRMPFSIENPWFSGACEAATHELAGLLGTKLRAMYQRKKVRDLFDMDCAVSTCDIPADKILRCWRECMAAGGITPPTGKEFTENMDMKMRSSDYLNDMADILRPGTAFAPVAAYAKIRELLIDKICD